MKAPYSYRDLVAALRIPPAHVERLHEHFDAYVKARGVTLREPWQIARHVYSFLHDEKARYKTELADSIIGKSGCFPFSVRAAILLGKRNIGSSLARSTGRRCIHVMLLDEKGQPFNKRELHKGGVIPMSLMQVRLYALFIQSTMIAAYAMRRRYRRLQAA